jgi:PDZ domain-containing secreted protein
METCTSHNDATNNVKKKKLGTTITIKNHIHTDTMRRINDSGNAI